VFDRVVTLDDVPDGYRAMNEREALKVMVRPASQKRAHKADMRAKQSP
jgi:hypothetical protein